MSVDSKISPIIHELFSSFLFLIGFLGISIPLTFCFHRSFLSCFQAPQQSLGSFSCDRCLLVFHFGFRGCGPFRRASILYLLIVLVGLHPWPPLPYRKCNNHRSLATRRCCTICWRCRPEGCSMLS